MRIAEQLKREGQKEGLKKGKLATAKNMLIEGFDLAIIKKITGLSEDELTPLSLPHYSYDLAFPEAYKAERYQESENAMLKLARQAQELDMGYK